MTLYVHKTEANDISARLLTVMISPSCIRRCVWWANWWESAGMPTLLHVWLLCGSRRLCLSCLLSRTSKNSLICVPADQHRCWHRCYMMHSEQTGRKRPEAALFRTQTAPTPIGEPPQVDVSAKAQREMSAEVSSQRHPVNWCFNQTAKVLVGRAMWRKSC